jgi:hypothetical protein
MESWMKRIAVLTVLVMLSAGLSMPARAQGTTTQNDRQAEKLAEKKQKALYKYQKQQLKAQQKAQRDADKRQEKAAKKYEKEQRKMLKDATVPAIHSS